MRLRLLSLVVLGASAVTAAMATSCAVADADCTSDGTCPSATSGDGGLGSETSSSGNVAEGGEADAVAPPAGCNASADPKDPNAAPCIDDAFALFVSAGATGGDGTKAKPYGKIGDALDKVSSTGKKRVYICGALTYAEHVEVTAANAAWLLGGFDCTTWAATSDKPKVAPTDAGYALHIDSVGGDFRVEDMAFEAIAGTADKPSSIAAFVASSPNVTFTRVNLTAHDGASGANGAQGATGVSNPVDGTGSMPTGVVGGPATTCTCSTGGATVGGRGGDISGGAADGQSGLPAIAPTPPDTGAPSTNAQCSTGNIGGQKGASAAKAADAVSPKPGLVSAMGWSADDGGSGMPGGPGQGGGGAGGQSADNADNAGGSSGGCGGCGGSGGGGGKTGGSSVALLAFNSPVSLVSANLVSGVGGMGGLGQSGGPGGFGANGGVTVRSGCKGGHGGNGGNGGSGAGGSGGYSAAVFYTGAAPTNTGSTLTPGTLGKGGLGGIPTQNDGPDGKQGDILEAPTP